MRIEATQIEFAWHQNGGHETFNVDGVEHTVRVPTMTLILADENGNDAVFTARRDAFTEIAATIIRMKNND